VYEEMRAEGALCVADEVQCGFGRHGSCFWAFEDERVVPDVVTLGKPIGNGFPLAATVSSSCHQYNIVSYSDKATSLGGQPLGRPVF